MELNDFCPEMMSRKPEWRKLLRLGGEDQCGRYESCDLVQTEFVLTLSLVICGLQLSDACSEWTWVKQGYVDAASDEFRDNMLRCWFIGSKLHRRISFQQARVRVEADIGGHLGRVERLFTAWNLAENKINDPCKHTLNSPRRIGRVKRCVIAMTTRESGRKMDRDWLQKIIELTDAWKEL